jgi:hypothetical protein
MTKKISMVTLQPQKLGGVKIAADTRIETTRKVAAVLTRLNRAREVPDFADFHDDMIKVDPTPVEVVAKRKPGRPKKVSK